MVKQDVCQDVLIWSLIPRRLLSEDLGKPFWLCVKGINKMAAFLKHIWKNALTVDAPSVIFASTYNQKVHYLYYYIPYF